MLLTREMLDVLGVDAGDTLLIRAVDGNLIIRKDGTPELTPDQLATSMTAQPETIAPPEGLRAAEAHLVAIIHDHGPLRTVEIAERAAWSREHTSKVVNRLGRSGWLKKTIAGWELGPLGHGWVESAEL